MEKDMLEKFVDELHREIDTETTSLDEMLKIHEVSLLMKCSTRHIRRMVYQGRFPRPIKLGRLARWTKRCVSTWLNEQMPQL